jgi:hypothetical protein
MKRKIITAVLTLILLWCEVLFLLAPSSMAINVWDKISSKQSDLMYKYNTYLYPDPTKYWNPMSSINQRYYSTISDLNYKYRSFYTDPAKYWNPMTSINQSHHSTISDLTYKYHSSYTDPTKYWNPMPTISQRNYPMMSDPTYRYSSFYPDPTKYRNPIFTGSDLASGVHKEISAVAKLWDRAYPLPTSTPLRTARNIGLDVFGVITAIPRDIPSVRQGTYRWYTSYTLEKGAFFLLSKMERDLSALGISAPLAAIGEFTKGISSQIGRRQLVPNINEITSYLDAFNMGAWYMLGGPELGPAFSTVANFTAWGVRSITMPIFQAWADKSVYSQNLESQKILQKRWAYDERVLGIPQPPQGASYMEVVRHFQDYRYHQNPSNFAQDINLLQTNLTSIKPVDLSTISPEIQRFFNNSFLRGEAIKAQLANQLNSLGTSSLNNWLGQTSLTPSINSLFSNSSFSYQYNSMVGFGSNWSLGSSWLNYFNNSYSSYGPLWSKFNYGYQWLH